MRLFSYNEQYETRKEFNYVLKYRTSFKIKCKKHTGLSIGFFEEYCSRQNPENWIETLSKHLSLNLTPFKFGSFHFYYDGPNCSFHFGIFHFYWNNWKCKKCMGEVK